MRRLTLAMTFVLICGVASAVLAQDTTAAKPPADAKLRAEMHRTLAALIEARAADKPDQEQIQKLTDQLQELRKELGAPGAAARGGRRGGPGRGFGMGPGPGRGQGPGPGAGFGPGRGRGMGPAMGLGGGRGPGAGPGAGFGPGRGRGMGPAMGPRGGRGMGPGPGPGPGWARGGGPGRGYGPGPGRGLGPGLGFGRGWGFVDEDRNGVCDYYEQLWGKP
jgi:hypothetical protein